MGKYNFHREQETTVEEIRAMIDRDTSAGKWVGVLAAFLYVFGCRINEAMKLKPEDFEISEDYLAVKIALSKQKKKQTTGPYDMSFHYVHVARSTPFVDEFIIPYRLSIRGERVFPYSRIWAWRKLKELNSQISPHVFRHDRLTKLAMSGASGAVLQDWAGWSDLRPAGSYLRTTGAIQKQFADKVR